MVKKIQLALTLGSLITGILILFSSCKKINEATGLGGELIPAVDNITTFDTTINVEAYNDLFTLGGTDPLKEDSIYSHYSYEQFLGTISNDPLFGKTDAQMFFELKPTTYPYTFNNRPDSLILDSVVLVLDYVETYGDSTKPMSVNVSEVTSDFRGDTSYLMRKSTEVSSGGLLGSRTFTPSSLDDSVKAFQDTTSNQLRIRLSDAFGNRLLHYDTVGANNAYASDSIFKTFFKGFALKSTSSGSNALLGFNLQGTNTKLAIYYKYYHGVGSDLDTTVAYFNFKPFSTYLSSAASAAHNYVARDYTGFPISDAQGGPSPDPHIFIQNAPGSFARVKIPGLNGLSNRVVHRAELIAEEEYNTSDSLFPAPTFMYLDAFTSSTTKARNIPYDIVFDAVSQTYNLNSFGIAPINALDASGNVIKTWHFNLTRYVQHIANGTEPLYDLRLFSHVYASDDYYAPAQGATATDGAPVVTINPNPVTGRVRLLGNTGATDTNPHRMRLHIIYSKI